MSVFVALDLLALTVTFIVFLLTGVASTSELMGDVDSVRKRLSLLLSRLIFCEPSGARLESLLDRTFPSCPRRRLGEDRIIETSLLPEKSTSKVIVVREQLCDGASASYEFLLTTCVR